MTDDYALGYSAGFEAGLLARRSRVVKLTNTMVAIRKTHDAWTADQGKPYPRAKMDRYIRKIVEVMS